MDIKSLSDEQLAGQRLMVGFDGTVINNDVEFLIDTLKVGGIILFSQNISTPEQLRQLCSDIQEHASASGQPPVFIAVDQEGGQVARLKKPFTEFPGNPAIKVADDAVKFALITAKELAGVGINMNMAPVLDVADKSIDSIMAKRSFGHDPQSVSHLGTTVISRLQHGNIIAVCKHFPGIGRTTLDSHIKLPVLDTEIKDLQSFDLPPFRAAIEHNVAGIMLSHILYTKMDPKWPASLSRKIACNMLREQMGYNGLIITDDLDMGAIKEYYDIKTIIWQILSANIDIALICHRSPDMENAFQTLFKNIRDSLKLKTSSIESVNRILKLKSQIKRDDR